MKKKLFISCGGVALALLVGLVILNWRWMFGEKDNPELGIYSSPNPPASLAPDDPKRKYWSQNRQVMALLRKAEKEGLADAEVEQLLELSTFKEDVLIRQAATMALREIKNPEWRDRLIEHYCRQLKDPEWPPQLAAAQGLSRLKAMDKIPEILPLLDSKEAVVRERTRALLKDMGYQVPQ